MDAVRVTPPYEAEIVTLVWKSTRRFVLTLKVATVAPAGKFTLGGTVAAPVLLLDRETTTPSLGAGPLSVTAPVEVSPAVTLEGLSASEARVGGITASDAVRVTPLNEAEIVTEDNVPTGVVITPNVTAVDPPAIVTLPGTVATPVLLLDRVTTAPPLGAGALSVTVPVDGRPPVTVDGLSVSDERETAGAVTVSEAF